MCGGGGEASVFVSKTICFCFKNSLILFQKHTSIFTFFSSLCLFIYFFLFIRNNTVAAFTSKRDTQKEITGQTD